MDRILWNDDTEIDEVVLSGVDVHIEQMNGDPGEECWWIGVDRGDAHWSGNFAVVDGRLTFTEQENAGFVWDRDETHGGTE